jgi:hypothetical protein
MNMEDKNKKYRMEISCGPRSSTGYFDDVEFAMRIADILRRNSSVRFIGIYLDEADGVKEFYCYDKEGA